MADEVVECIPNLNLPQLLFNNKLNSLIIELITKDEMGPYLNHLILTNELSAQVPIDLLSSLESTNKTKLELLTKTLEDATLNLGETEIADALKAKAYYLTKIGHKELAIEALEEAIKKSAGLGTKIDLRLTIIRIGFFYSDNDIISKHLLLTDALVEEGGDWDRRNRLKVYQALHYLSIRNFIKATTLLFDTISTFTASELIEYNDFVTLAVLSGVLTLERTELKKKIIDSPEVISVLPFVPTLVDFTDSLYKCEYAKFFQSLATIETNHLIPSKLLSVHTRFYIRELRIKAYAQLLESYQSLTMINLSNAFGLTEDFIDQDLSRFIAGGRLNCSIDRVNGIVITNRPDAKNQRYEAVVKQGDILLTSVQRLSRVIG